jgi:3-dehydroquinate dehydratase / shikimate dehydrogenase
MTDSIRLIGVLTGTPPTNRPFEIPAPIDMLEVREDPGQSIPASWLRERFAGELLYTLTNSDKHGQGSCALSARHRSLVHAARAYDMVRLNADCDLVPEVLAGVPAGNRLISWRGPSGNMAHLRSVFQSINSVPARMYSMVVQGSSFRDGVKPLLLLKELRRTDLAAVCEGKSGFWTRMLAPHFGAPFVTGRIDHGPIDDSGEISVQQLLEDYGLPALHPICEIYGIVGNRVFQSPSPRLHNAGYRTLQHPALFLPFHVESFEDFWKEITRGSVLDDLDVPIRGFTVVSPFKEAAFAAALLRSSAASRAEASNLFVRRNGSWEAHTTDPESIAWLNLEEPLKAAVIGCGGAGRAIAAALKQAGAHVTLVNRGRERGEMAVKLLGLPFVSLSDFQPSGFSLLVNATPVGRDDNRMPFEIDTVHADATVVDLVYGTRPTPLVEGILARGGAVVDGYEVLLSQVRKQFLLMTGREMPAVIDARTAASFGHGENSGAVSNSSLTTA